MNFVPMIWPRVGGDIFWGSRRTWRRRAPPCGAAGANTRHACLCYRAGAQLNKHHQPLLVHAASRFLERLSIRHQVESGTRTYTYGHPYREGRPPRRVGIRFPKQQHFNRRHLRGPPSANDASFTTTTDKAITTCLQSEM